MTQIKRIIKQAFSNFIRNGWLSLTATLIMTLALLTVGVFLVVALSTNKIASDLKDKIDIVVNFKDTASEALIQQLKGDLMIRPDIKTVRYISKEDALNEFKQRTSIKEEIREIVTPEDNPLPRGLQIQSVNVSEYDYVSEVIKKPTYAPYIDSSSYDDNKGLIETVNNATKFVERFGLILSAFFILVSILVVFNTARLAVMFRAKEIEVMRLVGASDSYVKMPFLIEGFLYGFFALIIETILIYAGVNVIDSISSGTVFGQFVERVIPIYYSEFWFIVLIEFIVGTVIGVGSTYVSIRKNVKL